ncbi:MAG: oligosaccharide flippase family protein [Candidatus Omnitrophica bacterium]|nr:oligosaccharide flippase family protein [Candidatus Omnitrophota bacterium]
MKKQIAKNVFSNYVMTAISMVLGIFLIPFLIHKLGKEAFGLVVLAESTIAFFELATISVRMALSRYAAFSLSEGDGYKKFTEYLATGRGLLFFSAALVLAVAFPLGYNFPLIFRVPAELASQSQTLFFLIALAFSVSIPNIVFWSMLYAKERFDLINLSLSLGIILRAAGLFVFFSVLPPANISLVTYGLIYLAMILLQNSLIVFWQRRVIPGIRIPLVRFDGAKAKEMLSFTFHTCMSRMSLLFSRNILDVVINLFWGPVFNTIYSVGFKFPSVMHRLFVDGTWTLTPSFTSLVSKNDKERITRLFFTYTKLIAILAVPIGLFFIVMARQVIHFWVGDGFEPAPQILAILTAPLLTAIPFAVCGCLVNAYGRVKIPSLVSMVTAFLGVVLGVILGRYFSQGLLGIAIGSSIASLISSTIFLPVYTCRVAGIPLFRYLANSFLKPLVWSGAVMGLGALFFYDSLLGMIFIPFLCYAGAYFFVLDEREKRKMRELCIEMTGGSYESKNQRHHSRLQWGRLYFRRHRECDAPGVPCPRDHRSG